MTASLALAVGAGMGNAEAARILNRNAQQV